MFVTTAPVKTLLHKPSYSTLETQFKDANLEVSKRVRNVITQSKQGRLIDIDFKKLTPMQHAQINEQLEMIEELLRDQTKFQQTRPVTSLDYDKQRRVREQEDLFDECLLACRNEIKRYHLKTPVDGSGQITYLMELLKASPQPFY